MWNSISVLATAGRENSLILSSLDAIDRGVHVPLVSVSILFKRQLNNTVQIPQLRFCDRGDFYNKTYRGIIKFYKEDLDQILEFQFSELYGIYHHSHNLTLPTVFCLTSLPFQMGVSLLYLLCHICQCMWTFGHLRISQTVLNACTPVTELTVPWQLNFSKC